MIHKVFFWMTDDARETKKEEFEQALQALISIDLIKDAYVGTPAPTEVRPVTDNTFDYSIDLHFANQADHDAYQVHPEHDVFVAKCKDWWSQVKVYDSALIE